MKLFVPPLGTVVTLSKVWHFELHNEHRNHTLFDHFKVTATRTLQSIKASLPKGSKLKIDRYYIRQGLKDFDSVSFYLLDASVVQEKTSYPVQLIPRAPGPAGFVYECRELEPITTKRKTRVRFWVKLADANQIEFNDIELPKAKE